MEHDHHNPLSLLLSMLRDKQPGSPVSTVVNAKTINLMCRLLSADDYASFVEQLQEASDAKNLLDFILFLLRHRRLQNPDTGTKINQQARRFMTKVFIRMPVKPPSLAINATEITMPPDWLMNGYVGGGGFGDVYEGKYRGLIVALKILRKCDDSDDLLFYREALIWRSLKHEFILHFSGIYELGMGTASRLFLVSPYMRNDTLIRWRKKEKPSEMEIQLRLLEVAQGMRYIHSEGAVHGDLCGNNVLLDDDLHVKIADFGLTRVSKATVTGSGAFCRNFGAPELFGDGKSDGVPSRTTESDVYAFGCLCYEIYYGTMPFAGNNPMQIWRFAADGVLPPRQDDPPISDNSWTLIQSCWAREPSARPKMKEVSESVMAIYQSLSSVNPQNSSTAAHPTPPSWTGGAAFPPPRYSFAIHPFLDAETPRGDYSFNLSSQRLYLKQLIDGQSFNLDDDTLSEPATYPQIYTLRVICDVISNWSISIQSDPDSPPYRHPLTLGDVLCQIHRALHERIADVEWEHMDSGEKLKVRDAHFKRCKSEGPTMEELLKNDGVKKVDYLLDKVWFKGLIRTGEGPEVLKLVVSTYN